MSVRILNKTRPAFRLTALPLLVATGIFSLPVYGLTAFTPQNQPVGYVNQSIVTNVTLTSGTETMFQSEYEKHYWSGNMYAYPIGADGIGDINGERWSGGAKVNLEQQVNPSGTYTSTGRNIGTMRDDGNRVPFLSGSLSATQQTSLATTVNAISYTSTQITDFLRGDHSNESTTGLRQRLTPQGSSTTANVLGDIIHSTPIYLHDATYPTVFVGANDGMLHAFNTVDGTERWAYVPSMLISKMKTLAANPYTHDYFVDGQIAVGNVTISGTSTRILVGGLGAGGKGLYALNIHGSSGLTASSDQTAANKILWEISPTKVNYATPILYSGGTSATAYSNLGYTYGTPQIKTINVGTTAAPVAVQAVIVGNGYNNGGDYQAHLFVINAADGRLIKVIKADNTCSGCSSATNGSAGSPNGLFNPVAFDSDFDGYVDRVYAGDLNGTMWKFNLSSASANLASATASVLHITNPLQPITATPGVVNHPSGIGYMVNFGTGGIFTGTQPLTGIGATGDLGDSSTFYVYGIWDGAPVSNTSLTAPTLNERCYNNGSTPSAIPCPSAETRVRRATTATPVWTAGGNKGWRMALPIPGERVVGEGSYISSNRMYFTTHNPTISHLVPNTSTYVWGENWLMALESASGNSSDPFMDLDGDGTVTNLDRIKYTASDPEVIAGTQTVNTSITTPNADGISVGKALSRGVQSQPTLVKLDTLFTTLFNSNPDVTFPPDTPAGAGVAGGHFDEDIFYGVGTPATQATATITVSSTGSTLPATLGGIQVDGVTVVPALTIADLPDGTATSTNASKIDNSVTGVYTATRSGSTVTIKAPAGASYNGKTLTILPGTSSGSPGTAPANGTLTMTAVADERTVSLKCGTTFIGRSSTFTSSSNNNAATRLNSLYNTLNGSSVNGYGMSCTKSPNTNSPTSVTCSVSAPVGLSACSSFTVDNDITKTTNTGPSGGTNPTGWSDLAPALSTNDLTFSGGADGVSSGNTCTGSDCTYVKHIHQYDDKFDVTGVNMLNASDVDLNLHNAVPSTTQKFKVIMHNQYLNPAVRLNIGNNNYVYNVNFGYVSVKNYTTAATLDLATMPTYNRDPASSGNGLGGTTKYIGSLAVNMPVDALTAKDWWGNGDVRVGLLPTKYSCVWDAAGSTDGNMYRPVKMPANDATLGYPLDGPGTLGYSWATTPATATGLRHGGALVIQIIKDTTPNSALELNDHLGRIEYGWRVKSASYSTYVLAEYATYWHHPNGLCLHSLGWTKTPGVDDGASTTIDGAPGATDPKIGDLSGSASTIASVVVAGDTTTITNIDGSRIIIQVITNADGTVTTVTTNFLAGVGGTSSSSVVDTIDPFTSAIVRTIITIITHSDGSQETSSSSAGGTATLLDGTTISNETTARSAGAFIDASSGLVNSLGKGFRRISWKELINQ